MKKGYIIKYNQRYDRYTIKDCYGNRLTLRKSKFNEWMLRDDKRYVVLRTDSLSEMLRELADRIDFNKERYGSDD